MCPYFFAGEFGAKSKQKHPEVEQARQGISRKTRPHRSYGCFPTNAKRFQGWASLRHQLRQNPRRTHDVVTMARQGTQEN